MDRHDLALAQARADGLFGRVQRRRVAARTPAEEVEFLALPRPNPTSGPAVLRRRGDTVTRVRG